MAQSENCFLDKPWSLHNYTVLAHFLVLAVASNFKGIKVGNFSEETVFCLISLLGFWPVGLVIGGALRRTNNDSPLSCSNKLVVGSAVLAESILSGVLALVFNINPYLLATTSFLASVLEITLFVKIQNQRLREEENIVLIP